MWRTSVEVHWKDLGSQEDCIRLQQPFHRKGWGLETKKGLKIFGHPRIAPLVDWCGKLRRSLPKVAIISKEECKDLTVVVKAYRRLFQKVKGLLSLGLLSMKSNFNMIVWAMLRSFSVPQILGYLLVSSSGLWLWLIYFDCWLCIKGMWIN